MMGFKGQVLILHLQYQLYIWIQVYVLLKQYKSNIPGIKKLPIGIFIQISNYVVESVNHKIVYQHGLSDYLLIFGSQIYEFNHKFMLHKSVISACISFVLTHQIWESCPIMSCIPPNPWLSYRCHFFLLTLYVRSCLPTLVISCYQRPIFILFFGKISSLTSSSTASAILRSIKVTNANAMCPSLKDLGGDFNVPSQLFVNQRF